MVKVTKIDTPKPKKTKLYWGTLLLSWIPFVGLALSLNGVIRSALKVIESKKSKKINKRAVVGSLLSSIALVISVVAINTALNPTPTITLTNAETSTDGTSYTLTGKISNMENAASQLKINDVVVVPLNSGEFSYKVDLKEGDNIFNMVVANDNGETKKAATIHRTTQAEFAARAESEKRKADNNPEKEKKTEAPDQKKADNNAFYINNAYYKGDGRYDIVVHGSSKETLQMYVNDKNPVRTKVNEEGWATFEKVKLTGRSKLSFAKKVGWIKYHPVNYVKYISVDGEQVKLMDAVDAVALDKADADAKVAAEAREPRHTYDEFYTWVTTYMRSPDGSGVTRRSYITDQCDGWKDLDGDRDKDQYFDKSCLQDQYKEYIKPSAFDYGSSADNGGSWLCPNGQEYQYLCSRFFDMETHIKAQLSGAYGVNVDEEKEKAKTIYNEIAITKGGN